jgi:hypothetical protein
VTLNIRRKRKNSSIKIVDLALAFIKKILLHGFEIIFMPSIFILFSLPGRDF